MTIKNKSNRLWLIGLIFLLPVMISGVLYAFHTHIHFKTTNHGVLINPPLAVWGATHRWQVVYMTPSLKTSLSAVRVALGKNAERVTLLAATVADRVRISKAIVEYPQATVYLVDPLGNVFMVYIDPVNPMDILKDLMHVLQVSQIG